MRVILNHAKRSLTFRPEGFDTNKEFPPTVSLAVPEVVLKMIQAAVTTVDHCCTQEGIDPTINNLDMLELDSVIEHLKWLHPRREEDYECVAHALKFLVDNYPSESFTATYA